MNSRNVICVALLAMVALSANTTLLWKYPTANPVASTVAVANGAAFVGTDGNRLLSIDTKSGKLNWAFSPGEGWVQNSPLVFKGNVYFGTEDGNFYAVSATTGTQLWVVPNLGEFNGEVAATANINGVDAILIGSGGGTFYAMEALTGKFIWQYATGSAGIYDSDPVVYNGQVIFATYSGTLLSANITTGANLWSVTLPGCNAVYNPVVSNNVAYVGCDGAKLSAVAFTTTSATLSYQLPANGQVVGTPAVLGNTVIYNDNSGIIYAYDITSKTQKWSYTFGGSQNNCNLLIYGTSVVGGAYNGIYSFDVATGKIQWNYTTGDNGYGAQLASVTIVNGVAYFGSTIGGIYAVTVPSSGGSVNEMQCEDTACAVGCRAIQAALGCTQTGTSSLSRAIGKNILTVTQFFSSTTCDDASPSFTQEYSEGKCYQAANGGSFYWKS